MICGRDITRKLEKDVLEMGEVASALIMTLSAAKHGKDSKEKYKEQIVQAKDFFERVEAYLEDTKSPRVREDPLLNEVESEFILTYFMKKPEELPELRKTLNTFSHGIPTDPQALETLIAFYDSQLEYAKQLV